MFRSAAPERGGLTKARLMRIYEEEIFFPVIYQQTAWYGVGSPVWHAEFMREIRKTFPRKPSGSLWQEFLNDLDSDDAVNAFVELASRPYRASDQNLVRGIVSGTPNILKEGERVRSLCRKTLDIVGEVTERVVEAAKLQTIRSNLPRACHLSHLC